MIGLPWFLLAIGIVLVLVGSILSVLSAASRRKPPPITHKMRNKDIARQLQDEERVPWPAWIIYAGLACIAVSIGWRAVLRF
jgi:hypothetical protein